MLCSQHAIFYINEKIGNNLLSCCGTSKHVIQRFFDKYLPTIQMYENLLYSARIANVSRSSCFIFLFSRGQRVIAMQCILVQSICLLLYLLSQELFTGAALSFDNDDMQNNVLREKYSKLTTQCINYHVIVMECTHIPRHPSLLVCCIYSCDFLNISCAGCFYWHLQQS